LSPVTPAGIVVDTSRLHHLHLRGPIPMGVDWVKLTSKYI
jgi:hypothetical protein